MRTFCVLVAALALVAGVAPAARADELKAAISAPMLLDLLARPAEARGSAFDESLKAPGPAPRPTEGEVLPDGSVRYGAGSGSVTVMLKNPCPPGTAHYEPPPLPGRRR
ncbi:MAG: hypothetical protein HY616_10545 [Candidatus Rokubacteria bacterium]|nr:hypothetical protein [Candidatus Rokubacteria bacterium]MBI2016959.1 hypothetical protein [Candidatus Rokubacteria bacterium]MBI2157353.1 hypothetical protein [Candidatus Rokubacteria bacterium]MBI2491276.1 hypothetical protein [Candidatus Rokubacteria bacterium]MBI4255501.1 hypothetical protein [Candidatus Rokubacteria bacterium]